MKTRLFLFLTAIPFPLLAITADLLAQNRETGPAAGRVLAQTTGLDAIQHVVVIYQENWSFDGLYGKLPGARTASPMQGTGLSRSRRTARRISRFRSRSIRRRNRQFPTRGFRRTCLLLRMTPPASCRPTRRQAISSIMHFRRSAKSTAVVWMASSVGATTAG